MIPQFVARALRSYVRYAPGSVGKGKLSRDVLDLQLEARPFRTKADTVFGATFPVTTGDCIQRYLYLFGVWEPNFTAWMSRRLGPGDVFIDVGANIGYFSVLASRLVGPDGRVVAIEASPQFHRMLSANCEANTCPNVRTVNVAASDSPQELTFYLEDDKNLGGMSVIRPEGDIEPSFTVRADPLPDILTTEELTEAKLIKIDVEGAEAAVVRGLLPQLDKMRPDVEFVIEVAPERLQQVGDDTADFLTLLTEHGFHTYELINDYEPDSYPPTLRTPQAPTRWDRPVTEQMDLIFSRQDVPILQ
ncbi:MAG: hypothetical protein QG608_727 [Actinomycetota bacterium]|nr:hypothetical protein [Actinomycetota bacterium]